MLLELHDLDRCLRAAGIAPEVTDQRIQPYPNRAALELRLDAAGQITGIRLLQPDQLRVIRKFECSKGGLRESSPGFNVDPLWRSTAWEGGQPFEEGLNQWKKDWQAAKSKPQRRMDLLQIRAKHREVNWDLSNSSKINLCLNKAASVLRKEMKGAEEPVLSHLKPLAELLNRSESLDAKKLHSSLSDKIFAALNSSGCLDPEDLRKLLFSDRAPGDRKSAPNEAFSLILEIDDPSAFGGYPANHQVVWSALNQQILEHTASSGSSSAEASAKAEDTNRRVGIFGEVVPAKLGTMPEKTLPRVGKVKLFSLSHQTPCQARYGLVNADACPVGSEMQDRLSAALEWICLDERRGETWDDISNACGYKQPALLIAYTSRIPTTKVRLTSMIARDREDSSLQESRFEARTASVVESLQGLVSENPDLSVTILVITKADTARKKLLYSRQFAVQHVIKAAETWREAADNIPPISVRAFNAERKPTWVRPLVPYPNEILRVINTRWELDAKRPKAVSDATIGVGLTLLLETGPILNQTAREVLRPLISNVTPFVLALGHANLMGLVLKTGGSDDFSRLVPTVLGLVLAKAGQKKGEYMKRNPYQIGRLLSLADELHRNYCEHERKGKLPNGPLLGNSLLTTALANPVASLGLMATRSPVYLRVAGAQLRDRFGQVEKSIDKNNLPTHCTDEDKAQILLGYLARPELTDSTETDQSTTPETQEGSQS